MDMDTIKQFVDNAQKKEQQQIIDKIVDNQTDICNMHCNISCLILQCFFRPFLTFYPQPKPTTLLQPSNRISINFPKMGIS